MSIEKRGAGSPEKEPNSKNKEETYMDRYYEILNKLRPQADKGEKTNADITKEAQELLDSERGHRPDGFMDELNGLEMDFETKQYQERIELFESLARGEDPKGNRNREFPGWTDEDFKEFLSENARYREQHKNEQGK